MDVVSQQPDCNQKNIAEKSKNKQKNKCDLGPDFIAPDGGWGWVIVVAAGVSNLCCFLILQQFGLLFDERMKSIGLTNTQITTIINLNSCLTSCVGLANGPMFRKFTYRQVGLFGALLIALSILLMKISNSFINYVLTFSVLYGIGSGINVCANSMALNTYFKDRRRIATGLSWTIAGMGPIIMPQIIAVILPLYGVDGNLLLCSGMALVAVMCSLLYQPVQWHVKRPKDLTGGNAALNLPEVECDYCTLAKHNSISSQYLQNSGDSNDAPAQNIVGSAKALAKERGERKISEVKIEMHPKDVRFHGPLQGGSVVPSTTSSTQIPIEQISFIGKQPLLDEAKMKMNAFEFEEEVMNDVSNKLKEVVANHDRVSTIMNFENYCTCKELPCFYTDPQISQEITKECAQTRTLWQKVVIFFDLDLLRDFTYVNLLVGITLGNFADINFAMLTPFVLADWNFTKPQIAMFMSILGGVDIGVRLCIPFVAGKIDWENKTFFLVGIMGIAMGRVFITFFQSYWCVLAAFCWIGLGKGLRIVFMDLIIASHVPLSRLPAASGLQLLFAGIFFFVMGPVVGYIRDQTNYIVTLHCLNVPTFLVTICWLFEKFYRDYQERKSRSLTTHKVEQRIKQFLTAIVSPLS